MGRLERVQRVLDVYVAQMDQDIARLDSEWQAGNSLEVAKIAHRIKGASANAAVESIRADAESIERLVAANQLDELPGCMDRLKQDLRAIAASAARLHSMPVGSTAGGV
jgi:HPt (histidine-containing phosphotransfer) domain-containing protein